MIYQALFLYTNVLVKLMEMTHNQETCFYHTTIARNLPFKYLSIQAT